MDRPIRVLHIGLTHTFGGIGTFLVNLARTIDSDRICMDVLSYSNDTAFDSVLSDSGLRRINLNVRRENIFRYYVRLRELCSDDYDVVHIHKNSPMDFIPFLAARHSGVTSVFAHSHNTQGRIDGLPVLVKIGRRIINTCSTRRFACSTVAGKWLYGSSAMRSGKVELFNNGIDIDVYRYSEKKRQDIRSNLNIGDSILIGCVGRFNEQKNQAYLVPVFKELIMASVKARLVFLGDGTCLRNVQQAFLNAGLGAYVNFLGNVDNVSDYYSAFDVLAMPSQFEGFPFVAVEAQLCGLPIVLSDTITNEAILSNGCKSVSINNRSIEKWGAELLALAKSGRTNVSDLIRERFSSKNTGARMTSYYLMSIMET